MDALSQGFCAAARVAALGRDTLGEWQKQWPQPALQVVDIQRYPRHSAAHRGASRFYVAVSDGETLAWMAVPPRTALEEAIAGFELETGCCVTLLSHTLVTAANGVNVIVPLEVRYSTNTLRLLGQPTGDDTLFKLSPASLVQRRAGEEEEAARSSVPQRVSHRVALRDFADSPEKTRGHWSLVARVVWRGPEYPLHGSATHYGSTTATSGSGSHTNARFVVRCLLVDEHGDGMVAAFYGTEALMDRLRVHDCLRLVQGNVKWGEGESAAPLELQFVEKSLEAVCGREEEESLVLPRYAASLLGEPAQRLRSVSDVIASAVIGDVVSVVGTVEAVQANTQITTKRGRVWRSVVTLADETGEEGEREDVHRHGMAGERRGPFLEVTLWGDVAESVEPVRGERWVFHSCVVQVFQQRKTLSSRASTMAVQLRPAESNTEQQPMPPAESELPVDTVEQRDRGTAPSAQGGAVAFVLDLAEASPTLPVAVRVQEVVSPLLVWTCSACASTEDVEAGDTSLSTPCPACRQGELLPSFHMQVWLSDSLSTALVRFHGMPAEALLGVTPLELVRGLQRGMPSGYDALCAKLVGEPILVWLVPAVASEGSTASFIAVTCRHSRYTAGCHTLLSAIDCLMDACPPESSATLDDARSARP